MYLYACYIYVGKCGSFSKRWVLFLGGNRGIWAVQPEASYVRMLGMMVCGECFQSLGLVLRNQKKDYSIREYASRRVACVCLVALEGFL